MASHPKPKVGFAQYPHIDLYRVQNPYMAIMEIAQRNFVAWRIERPETGTLKQIAARAGVGFGTTQRLFAGDGNITVEKLEAVARVFGRSATDLLSDGGERVYDRQATETRRLREPMQVVPLWVAEQPPPDERLLLQGYRAASEELRELMLEVAKKAVAKQEQHGRSDHQ